MESLYDSLTDYFDPTDGRRQRKRTKTLEEEQADQVCDCKSVVFNLAFFASAKILLFQRDLELIAAMEAQSASTTSTDAEQNDEVKVGDTSDDDHKFYERKDRRRKKKEDASERPPTPTDG